MSRDALPIGDRVGPGGNAPKPDGVPWALLDADNTLWHVEPLYNTARSKLVSLLADHGVAPEIADAFQRKRDADLFQTLGYSDTRFEQSFVDTLYYCSPAHADPQLEREVRALAQEALSSRAETDPEAGPAIALLRRSYRLGMITAGEPSIQKRRIMEFPYSSAFDVIWCVRAKSANAFVSFCVEHSAARPQSVVIGDSIRSDVLPAIEAGLTPIWVRNQNWQEIENAADAPTWIHTVNSLLAAANKAVSLIDFGPKAEQ